MATTTAVLKERALVLIASATNLEDISYLTKSMSDSGQLDDTINKAIYDKVFSLSPTASAKEVAYIIKALENADAYSTDTYQIGTAGQIGFGVATCPSYLVPDGWTGMAGHDDIASPNYGNYTDANGSVLVYIPKHYYKYVGNELYISQYAASGYVVDRSFINAGAEVNGLFIYKYGASNLNGVFASQKMGNPLSTSSAHNPISGLTGSHANNYGGLYTAVKTAGTDYYLTSIFNYSMLARLAFAHGKAATSTTACAYIDVNPKMPKGCLANVLRDVNDSGVTFTSDGYSNCAKTGSGTPFAKTTHNGQECGIADLNGNMWEVASGFIRYDSDGFLVLKESVDIRSIVNDSVTTAGGGAYDRDLYDVIDISDLVSANDGWTYLGNGAESVFAMSTTRTTAEYKRTALGIPKATGVSASGTTEFGNDGVYRYLRNEMACQCGGNWSYTSYAGAFAMHLYYYRTTSLDLVGGRASFLV